MSGNKASDSIISGIFFGQLCDCQQVKQNFFPQICCSPYVCVCAGVRARVCVCVCVCVCVRREGCIRRVSLGEFLKLALKKF